MRALRPPALAALMALACGTAVQLVAPPPQIARAQSDEQLAAARALFNEGIELEKKEDWAGALAKFERVAAVKMTPQVRFHIGLCQENLGRLVEAINSFELAEQEARASGADDVLRAAPERAKALRERVAHVTISVDGTIHTSVIAIDGKPVAEALLDTPIPIDPGDHELTVTRDGEVVDRRPLIMGEAETQELTLEIDDPEPVDPDPVPDPNPIVPKPNPDTTKPDEGPGRIPAYVVGGAGVAMMAVGGALLGVSRSRVGSIIDNCDDPDELTGCDPEDEAAYDEARTFDTTGLVLLGVGGAALATGVVLFFVLAPDDEPPTTGNKAGLRLLPYGDYGAGILLDARW